jgi:acyl-CoA synthetase (AMP-forming)/AMP-acid ligase II
MLQRFETLAQYLLERDDRSKGIFHVKGEDQEKFVSYPSLKETALGLLGYFQSKGLRPGGQLVIATGNNEQFIDAFWACQLGGLVPVPVSMGISDEHRAKIYRIAEQLENPHLFIDQANLDRLGIYAQKHQLEGVYTQLLKTAIVIDAIEDLSTPGTVHPVNANDLALIQFSSGSTSEPKGVMLTQENLTTNIHDILEGIDVTANDRTVSWMPLTHDMGLIGFHLCELVQEIDQYLMTTELFVRRPLLWMQVAALKKITVTCSPNFGYKHFLKAFSPDKYQGLDLSSIRVIFNGAEPISRKLADEFLQILAPFGLKKEAMFPVYGLAEASLAVAFPEVGSGIRSLSLDKDHLSTGSSVLIHPDEHPNGLEYVIEGFPLKSTRVRIIDHNWNDIPENSIGTIAITGKNVTQGYYLNLPVNNELVRDRWVNTGDLGFLHHGELR